MGPMVPVVDQQEVPNSQAHGAEVPNSQARGTPLFGGEIRPREARWRGRPPMAPPNLRGSFQLVSLGNLLISWDRVGL